MHNKALKSLVVSLFCFAFCAWAAGLVKPSADLESQVANAKNICSHAPSGSPARAACDKGLAEILAMDPYPEEGGAIAAAVLFGFAGLVAFVGVFTKDSSRYERF